MKPLSDTIGAVHRRRFLTGGAAFAVLSTLAMPARADEVPLAGILLSTTPWDSAGAAFLQSLLAGLADDGWRVGENLAIAVRYSSGDRAQSALMAAELAALGPDILVCASGANAEEAARIADGTPVVFVDVSDPLRLGLVQSLARPGLNATGFAGGPASQGGKWLGLLAELDPAIERVVFVYRPDPRDLVQAAFPFIQDAAAVLGVRATTRHVQTVADVEDVVRSFVGGERTGYIFGPDAFTFTNRAAVLNAVAGTGLPALYPFIECVEQGGLISYSFDLRMDYREAGRVAAQILSGRDPAEIPVQYPSRYLLAINVTTAATIGLAVPNAMLAMADRLVE